MKKGLFFLMLLLINPLEVLGASAKAIVRLTIIESVQVEFTSVVEEREFTIGGLTDLQVRSNREMIDVKYYVEGEEENEEFNEGIKAFSINLTYN